jgi:osmoprotectant transport system permease protein
VSAFLSLALSHLRISLLSLSLGILIAAPLGIAAARRPRLERVALGFAGVVQTIPGLALLAAMVPALALLGSRLGVHVPSIGDLPAVLALSVYAVLPILRGLVLGISSIDRAIVEAADAVGMTSRERLRMVELPLSVPHIVGGLRTATVWTVGMATLATPVGGRSLGELIFGGLQTRHYDEVLRGCGGAAALALGLDILLRAAESGARARKRSIRDGALGALGLLVVWAIGATAYGAIGDSARPLRVGAKSFTEQKILGEVLGRTLEKRHEKTEVVTSLGSSVAFDALAGGEIDVYVEYTGTVWTTFMHRTDVPADRTELRRDVEAWLTKEKGIVVVASLGFEDAYALMVRRANPAQRISDLGAADSQTLGADYEFLSRPEWAALQSSYGIRFKDRRPMDPSLLYDAVANGSIDVGTGFSSDARIDALGLKVLEDDKNAIPPYDAVILARSSFEKEHPDAYRALAALDGAIDVEKMRAMNLAVDRDHRDAGEVAGKFVDGR